MPKKTKPAKRNKAKKDRREFSAPARISLIIDSESEMLDFLMKALQRGIHARTSDNRKIAIRLAGT